MIQLCEAGASTLDPTTGTPLVQCKNSPVGVDDDDAQDYGEIPYMCALGVFAKPAPADADGAAQLLVDDDVPGTNGAIVGGYDLRTSKEILGELGPGETCIAATAKGYKSRVFCKDQLVALVVDNDTAIIVDRKNEQISITAGESMITCGKDGITLRGGGAELSLAGGVAALIGQVVLGGRNPSIPLLSGPVPVVGAPGTGTPVPGVFMGIG